MVNRPKKVCDDHHHHGSSINANPCLSSACMHPIINPHKGCAVLHTELELWEDPARLGDRWTVTRAIGTAAASFIFQRLLLLLFALPSCLTTNQSRHFFTTPFCSPSGGNTSKHSTTETRSGKFSQSKNFFLHHHIFGAEHHSCCCRSSLPHSLTTLSC